MKSTARSSNTPQPVGMAIVSLGVLGFGVLVFLLGVYRSVHLQWDDGYITFRYAQHLAHGQGLTWNVGAERVEGYTSLFDVALLALGMKLGIAPNAASVAIGVCSVLGTVAYLWGRNADVYFGYEPPASAGAERPEDDARMQSRYVQEGLVQRELRLVQARVLLKDPVLLHHRMRELRDHWVLVGEIPWTGFDSWGLKSFAYVRNASPHREQLVKALQKLAATPPNAITL